MTSRLGAAWAAWERFWFGPVDLVLVSLFRLVFGSGLFLFYLGRQWDYRFLFSEEGIAPYALARAALDEHARTVGWLASAGPLGPILHVLLLALLLGLAVGTLGRGFAWAALVLHLVFIQRNPFVAYGPDMVATCWLLYLSLTDCNRYLALRPRWMGGPRALGPAPELTRDP
ncbi:MAG TPA: hypothetical protein VFM29_07940, partial [Vicinamibacteria bacterium]|nr:hypothetical protein [Vicinamibacteria bacterium]